MEFICMVSNCLSNCDTFSVKWVSERDRTTGICRPVDSCWRGKCRYLIPPYRLYDSCFSGWCARQFAVRGSWWSGCHCLPLGLREVLPWLGFLFASSHPMKSLRSGGGLNSHEGICNICGSSRPTACKPCPHTSSSAHCLESHSAKPVCLWSQVCHLPWL